ncbi:ABC transporter ATP-binding protein [Acetobacteraceae bacterium KSS8]|uniref:ABC transporter ATP-binding protein n=1 Tax=Endosaccharibacter trunci TaxID=2812733 RepID=A0ABT1W6T2_9PROT|nr:ABC transporter ATP-binding protein [Acetobacteraceae bacterium KSS8]
MPPVLLDLSDVAAGYGGRIAIQDASLRLEGGQLLGLIGPNGAGKSTLLRAVAGLIPALAGSVAIDGHPILSERERALSALGYAVDPAELPAALTGRQYLEMVASVRRCQATDWPEPELDHVLGFRAWLDTPLAQCSLGTRAKLSIAAALLGAPALLVLDESLNGLDPVSSWRLRQILQRMVATGRHAAILSTHQIEMLGSLCTDLVYVEDGRIAYRWNRLDLETAGPGGIEAMVMTAVTGTAATIG